MDQTNYREVTITQNEIYLTTIGLKKIIGKELRIRSFTPSQIDEIQVLKYLISYFLDFSPKIKNEQTISYYSWLLKFVAVLNSHYDIWEVNADGTYTEGAITASKIFNEQLNICKKYGVSPNFPNFGQLVVVSSGVYEGLGIEAVRYPSPEHMSGWWLTTKLYDGNIGSLKKEHFYHIAFRRSDIIKYMALPSGYRFYKSEDQTDIWFDENVSNS